MDAVRAPATPLSPSTVTSPQMRGDLANLGGGVCVVDFHCEGWVKFRRLVVCPLEGRASVRQAFYEAASEFERLFGGRARFGFVKKLPKEAVSGQQLAFGEGHELYLFEAEWMLERCVAVGCRMSMEITQMQTDDATQLALQMMK